MEKLWRIWFEKFNSNGEKTGAGVSCTGYKYKQNACRAAKRMYGNRPEKFKCVISIENPFAKDVNVKASDYTLAICEIGFKNTEYAVVVKKEDKELAEAEMALAYDCWSSEDEEQCIIPGYDTDVIGQACYGDFIIEWLRKRGISCNEDIGFVMLDTYCHDEPPADCEEDACDWRDVRITMYWFEKSLLVDYLKTLNTTVEEYLHTYTYDDVDCGILQEVPYAFKLTVINE